MSKDTSFGSNVGSLGFMTSLLWQTGLQDRQCHALKLLVKQASADSVSDRSGLGA